MCAILCAVTGTCVYVCMCWCELLTWIITAQLTWTWIGRTILLLTWTTLARLATILCRCVASSSCLNTSSTREAATVVRTPVAPCAVNYKFEIMNQFKVIQQKNSMAGVVQVEANIHLYLDISQVYASSHCFSDIKISICLTLKK